MLSLAHLSTLPQSLTLRWMNPKKNQKWIQPHMSAHDSTYGWGVSAWWNDILQVTCICISVKAIRTCSPSQQGWWHADSPQWGCFPSSEAGWCRSIALLSPGSPVDLMRTCAIQLAWASGSETNQWPPSRKTYLGHILMEHMTSALFSSNFHGHLYAIIIMWY